MALLASALKNNVTHVETQAQSINLFHYHESHGVGQFLPTIHSLVPFPPLHPSGSLLQLLDLRATLSLWF